jgi:rSAM/selenodomain-associated transferase 1
MDSRQDIVLIFTRYPVPGKSKTRLVPILGAQGAAELQQKMTERLIEQADRLAAGHPHRLEIHHDGGSLLQMQDWLGASRIYRLQAEGDLGARMAHAIMMHLGNAGAIILTGTDCPAVTDRILAGALEALRENDLVIGPACDGGYYLIGVRGGLQEDRVWALFTDISWGAETVFADTVAKARASRLTFSLLPEFHDIDRPEDLGYLDYYSDAE